MKPLEPEDLDKLQTVLIEQMPEVGCLPLDMTHGLLTAIAAGPREIPKEEWLPRILGDMKDDAEAISDLLLRFQAQLLIDLDLSEYGPLIMQMPREDGSMLPIPFGWCQGYISGLEMLGETVRDTALDDAEAAAYLAPIFAFMMYDESQYFDPPDEDQHRATVAELGPSAISMFHWWNTRTV